MQPRPNQRLSSQAMAFVLAGGRGSRLKELTDRRAKPAVYFGGKTRIIDFALSNALNSGIRKMAIATQYKAHSPDPPLPARLELLPGRTERISRHPARVASGWTRSTGICGTADAVTQNIDIVDSYGIKYVVILAGDHIYKMDYEVMLRQHVDSRGGRDHRLPDRAPDGGDGLRRHGMSTRTGGSPTFWKSRRTRRRIPGDPDACAGLDGDLCLRLDFPARAADQRRRRTRIRPMISATT